MNKAQPKPRIATQPRYLAGFKCLGGSCPDTCCSGWRIDVDKQHYKALKRAAGSDPAVKHLVANLTRYDDGNTKKYGTIKLKEDGSAPCLTADGQCSIQRALGHEMLPEICQVYPRYYMAVGTETELHGTLSCPEVARLSLLDPDAFSLEEAVLQFPPNKPIPHNRGFHAKFPSVSDPIRRNFHAVRDFLVSCIDAKGLSLYDRLLFATATVNKLSAIRGETDLTADAMDKRIEFALLETRLAMIQAQGSAATSGEGPDSAPVLAQLSLLSRMTEERLRMGGQGKRFLAHMVVVFTGLRFDPEDMSTVAGRYVAARDHYLTPLLQEHPHLLENLVKGLIYSDGLPTGKNGDLEKEWGDVLIALGLIRAYLIGLAADMQSGFRIEHCVDLIQSFYRAIQHNNKYYEQVRAKLQELEINSLATFMLLVK